MKHSFTWLIIPHILFITFILTQRQILPDNWTPFQQETSNNTTKPDTAIPAWDTEANVNIPSDDPHNPSNPLNTNPDAFLTWSATDSLRNFDQQFMQILFMRSERFNTTLNDTELFTLNNRVYAFNWKNGVFDRMPFPTNTTFPYFSINLTNQTNEGIVLSPLKNRFPVRAENATQMRCSLHARVLEVNHYVGKFKRLIVQFYSSCMDYPIMRYILVKSGLRITLQLTLFRQQFIFQFRGSYRTTVGNSITESYKEYRLLPPTHTPANFVRPNYKSDNNTVFRARVNNRTMSPQTMFALQANTLQMINQNYINQLGIFNSADQNREWTTRNDIFPRKAKGNKEQIKEIKEEKIMKINKPTQIKEKTKQKKEKVKVKKNRKAKNIKKNLKNPKIQKIQKKEKLLPPKSFDPIANFKPKKKRILQNRIIIKKFLHNNKMYRKLFGKSRKLAWRRGWWGEGQSTWENDLGPLLNLIRTNEGYKVDTCQRICRMNGYYHSWDFCLRVCGVQYNFLSNVQDPYANLQLFAKVNYLRVASGLFYLSSNAANNRQFSLRNIKLLWVRPQVISNCQLTWTRVRCEL